ncbi:LPXTG cell wall anchor domain-containing protein [Mesobacillus subterraneus]|uniref:LPXTG cell wall anchor domain-containing protein n=1 Tax=Mesobacillus subterraneus TaxID=285983 RepID=UPI00203C6D01|nr:LPXTG cell wall anchor domain-containing protein [Mesobacillus subterraneus]MCM3663273.1 LPXTG cell wall anchor domain-containing protein [Mesobacillus subterraneus]MCM3683047.1 LPXTG cell wall anchor domain-containing protein [Mesobacillus subterraneus]
MKALKQLSILLAFMLILFSSLPATGAFAASNNGESSNHQQTFLDENGNDKEKTKDLNENFEKEKADQTNNNVTKKDEQNNNSGKEQAKQDKTEKEAAKNEKKQKEEKKEEVAESTKDDSAPPAKKNESDSNETDTKAKEVSTNENANKSTQIHLHLNKCTNPVSNVSVQLNGEWKEMSNPGNSPLYKLLDGGEFVKDDVTAFKLVFISGEEFVVPVSDVKVGVEANGTINYWLENCEIPEKGETDPDKEETDTEQEQPAARNTQIHLHLKDCLSPVSQVFVELNGEWKEMSNPGNSPLYKLLDGGEFVKDDVTAFKLVFTSEKELVVPVSDVKVGVEAEGTINYWLENCDLLEEKVTFFTLNLMVDDSQGQINRAALLMMNGKRIEFKYIKNVWTITLTEETLLEQVRGIELTSNGKTKLFLLSQLSNDLVDIKEGILTLNLNWSMQGEMVEEENDEDTSPAPVNNSGSGDTHGGTSNMTEWSVLPQTGESSRMMFYLLGFLIAAGGVILRFRNPLKN